MGSRIMHYCITSRLAKLLNMESAHIHIGGIAPDVQEDIHATKDQSHFVTVKPSGKKRIDYKMFLHKYKNSLKEPFSVGYFSHLVADYLWYDLITVKYFKALPDEGRKAAVQKGYADFRKLNGMLITYYGIEKPDTTIKVDTEIEEVNLLYLPILLKQFEEDFDNHNDPMKEGLEIYEFKDIIAYIEHCVDQIYELIQESSCR
ncbi:hypothetical protein [Paenibacillus flagellatus]|uniref:Phospholipase C/D domain-containing protein n=1 Tax=Paenibacillus flagellatus TaxID=2211139 RepID=A0A2V5K687_9BACL|nr:hypothetical protein [Paenibacillus flagellatus]PYI54302.1 hypothetical protein DLM86_12555 [Paenibacillus flagellatus]